MPPQHFGKYLLLDRIGSGGMAEVFLAKQRGIKGFEKILAIKRILPNLTENSEFVTMFINEAKLAALLSHQNIVQIFELGHFENVYYIAMEYVMGKDLRTFLQQTRSLNMPPSIGQILLIFTKACAGLDYAHRKKDLGGKDLKIVHRDISPQNILVSYEGEVKLVDFGIAKAASQSSQTRAGMIKGKLAYLSPEQAWGKPLDSRTDIFALGIILYEMLTGKKLYQGDDEFSTLEKVRQAKVDPPPSKLNAEISPELEAIVLRALAKEPRDRYQSVSELQMALEDLMSQRRYDFNTIRFTQYIQRLFSAQLEQDSERFRAAELASAETPTQDKSTVVRTVPRKRVAPEPAPSTKRGIRKKPSSSLARAFATFRLTIMTLTLVFLTLVWMARVDFPLAYSLRVRSPSAQILIDNLARLPDRVFERWVLPYLKTPIPEPLRVVEAAPPSVKTISAVSAPGPITPIGSVPNTDARPHRGSLMPRDRQEVKRLIAESESDYNRGNLRLVEKKLRSVIDIDPYSPRAYHLLGTVLLEQKESLQALKIFEEATRLFPENPRLRYDLGFLYMDYNLVSLARNELTTAVELSPDGRQAAKAKRALEELSQAVIETEETLSVTDPSPITD